MLKQCLEKSIDEDYSRHWFLFCLGNQKLLWQSSGFKSFIIQHTFPTSESGSMRFPYLSGCDSWKCSLSLHIIYYNLISVQIENEKVFGIVSLFVLHRVVFFLQRKLLTDELWSFFSWTCWLLLNDLNWRRLLLSVGLSHWVCCCKTLTSQNK